MAAPPSKKRLGVARYELSAAAAHGGADMKSFYIVEEHLPLAWEQAVIACWQQGGRSAIGYPPGGSPAACRTCGPVLSLRDARRERAAPLAVTRAWFA